MSSLPGFFKDITSEFADTSWVSQFRFSIARHENPTRIADMHYHLEMGIVTKGRMKRTSGGTEREFGPGDIWFSGIFEPHSLNIVKVPAEIFMYVIDPAYLSNTILTESPHENWLAVFMYPPSHRPVLPENRKPEILSLSQRLADKQSLPDTLRNKWETHFLFEFLLVAEECASGQETVQSSGELFIKIKPAIETTLKSDDKIDSDAAAELCNMSRRNFDRLFTAALGIPFSQFSLRCRLRKAARELLRSDNPLKNIANEFHFTDAAHFANAFKTFFGTAPGKFRTTGW